MASTRSPLSVGELAYYHDPGSSRECTVLIDAILEGYPPRRYQVTNVDSGASFWSYGCWLRPILVDNKPFSWSQLEDENLSLHQKEAVKDSRPLKKARFMDLTEEDLDKIASDRVSKNTQQQTRWGIKILTGKSIIME